MLEVCDALGVREVEVDMVWSCVVAMDRSKVVHTQEQARDAVVFT